MWDRVTLLLLAAVAGVLGGAADVWLNVWVKSSGWMNLVIGYLFWNLALALFVYLLKTSSLAEVVIWFLVANSAVVLGASKFYFVEDVSLRQWIGIALALIGVIIMESR